jgi:phospholipase C
VVVIFQENVSFDHYFATYPVAKNPAGYTSEQKAFDMGLMDKFPEYVGVGGSGCDYNKGKDLVMGYYDGNTVTALWNYAQYFAMNGNSYSTAFGPSTVGALNLIAGSTASIDFSHTIGDISHDYADTAVTNDPDPYYDDCGAPEQTRDAWPEHRRHAERLEPPRQPFLVVSPWAKSNFVNNNTTDQGRVTAPFLRQMGSRVSCPFTVRQILLGFAFCNSGGNRCSGNP